MPKYLRSIFTCYIISLLAAYHILRNFFLDASCLKALSSDSFKYKLSFFHFLTILYNVYHNIYLNMQIIYVTCDRYFISIQFNKGKATQISFLHVYAKIYFNNQNYVINVFTNNNSRSSLHLLWFRQLFWNKVYLKQMCSTITSPFRHYI